MIGRWLLRRRLARIEELERRVERIARLAASAGQGCAEGVQGW